MNTLRFITKDVNIERYCFVMKASKTEIVDFEEFTSRHSENAEEVFEEVVENLHLKPAIELTSDDNQYSLEIYEADGMSCLTQHDACIELFDNCTAQEMLDRLCENSEYNNRKINKILKDNIDELGSILGSSIGFMFCEDEE